MLECAIVSVNVVLYGLPAHAEKTAEGWAVLRDWRESGKDYAPPVKEETEIPKAEETAPEAAEKKTEDSDP